MNSPEISVQMLSWINARLREQAAQERMSQVGYWSLPQIEFSDVVRVTSVIAAMFGGLSLMACQACVR